VLSTHGDHNAATDRTTLQFNANGSATITDSLGQARNCQFTVSHRAARLVSLDVACDTCSNVAAAKTWDSNGYPASSTDFEGNTTAYTFDAGGKQVERIQAAGSMQSQRTETDWLSNYHQASAQRTYDANGTLVTVSAYSYNSRGQILSYTRTDPTTAQSRTTTYSYCEASSACPFIGLLAAVADPLAIPPATATTWAMARNGAKATCGNGQRISTIDALGRITSHGYDALQRLQQTTQDAGGIPANTNLTYNALNQRTVTVDPKGLQTAYQYTAFGELLQLNSPDTGTTIYQYDNAGNQTAKTDANGQTVHYAYDAIHRIISSSYPGAPHLNVTYLYDDTPKPSAMPMKTTPQAV